MVTTPFVTPIVNGHIHLSLSASLLSSSFAEGEDGDERGLRDAVNRVDWRHASRLVLVCPECFSWSDNAASACILKSMHFFPEWDTT